MSTTVGDVNKAFQDKKMDIVLPYPEEWLVQDLQILEKKDTAKSVKVLLAVELIRDKDGKSFNDMCYLEGDIEREQPRGTGQMDAPQKSDHILPARDRFDFSSDTEALDYMTEVFSALLLDNKYLIEDHAEADIYAQVGKRGFFLMLACRCNEEANQKAQQLIDLRKKYKHMHDYGLIMPAFQEPFGIALSEQENWIHANEEILSIHRVGVYGVDNSDPNRIYPFTIYPQVRGLLRYFVAAVRQWQAVRAQYIKSRGNVKE